MFDCVVIGAGIVGAAIAGELAEDGLKTAIFEEFGIGAGTTAAGMGHIVVMDDSEAQFALTEYSRRIWSALEPRLPERCEYQPCGTIWVAADAAELDEAKRKFDFYQARSVACELLDERSLHEAEPNLREGLAGGLLVPDDNVVYQPQAAGFFAGNAVRAGAVIERGRRVAAVRSGEVRLADGTRVTAGSIVVAAGIGTTDLFPELKIRSKKGHLVITERYPGFVSHQIVELGYLKSAHSGGTESVAFNVQPRRTDQVLIGSSRQIDVADDTVDHRILGRMMRRAMEYMPGLERLSAVRIWTGLRPATDDNLPFIGRHPDLDRVYVAAGHEGLGITAATGTATIIADMIAGRKTGIDAAPFDPARIYSE